MVINLAFGILASGINNAAHVGGMIMGAVLAVVWYFAERKNVGILTKIIFLIIGAIITYMIYLYLLKLVQPITPIWQEIWAQMKAQLGL